MPKTIPAAPLVLLFFVGCSSGRTGSIHATQQALILSDAAYPVVSILYNDKVKRLNAHAIVPMNPSGRSLVLSEFGDEFRWLRFQPEKPNGPRVLIPTSSTHFRLYDLRTDKIQTISHPFDQSDEWITSSCVDHDRIAVEVGSRYAVGPGSGQYHYHVCQLPNGRWESIDEREWSEIRSAATSGQIGGKRIVPDMRLDGWGKILEQHDQAGWRTYLQSTNGEKRLILVQNDLGFADNSSRAARASGPIWP